jgi:hypothetical protein
MPGEFMSEGKGHLYYKLEHLTLGLRAQISRPAIELDVEVLRGQRSRKLLVTYHRHCMNPFGCKRSITGHCLYLSPNIQEPNNRKAIRYTIRRIIQIRGGLECVISEDQWQRHHGRESTFHLLICTNIIASASNCRHYLRLTRICPPSGNACLSCYSRARQRTNHDISGHE